MRREHSLKQRRSIIASVDQRPEQYRDTRLVKFRRAEHLKSQVQGIIRRILDSLTTLPSNPATVVVNPISAPKTTTIVFFQSHKASARNTLIEL